MAETKTISRGNLGGQNTSFCGSGARSSRALSTIFRKLQRVDRKIGELDREIDRWKYLGGRIYQNKLVKLRLSREKLDLKRKEIRNERKGYINGK